MQPVPNVLVGQSEIHTVIDCLGKSAKQEQQNPFQKSEANFLWRMSTPDLWTLTLTINWGGPQNSDTVESKNRTASLRDESTADNTRPQKLGCTHKHQYCYMHMMYLFMCIIMYGYVLCMYNIIYICDIYMIYIYIYIYDIYIYIWYIYIWYIYIIYINMLCDMRQTTVIYCDLA